MENSRLQQEWEASRHARRVVVKIGSNLLTRGGESLQRAWIDARVGDVARLMADGRKVVVVTSGAVAAGAPRLKLGHRPRTIREKQAAAAAGQGVLMAAYDEACAHHHLHAAQVLLTREDSLDRRRYLNARDTLGTLLGCGLLPVVNENDTVATEEIRFGDNDTLAALVAGMIDADLLILLSDVDGLYEANPRRNPDARRLPVVAQVTPQIEALAGGEGSGLGSGGMETKLRAARKAARFGCRTLLADGFLDDPIMRCLGPEPVGTLFLAEGDPIGSRKRWIVDGLVCQGEVQLDDGAVRALRSGRSLLAKGVLAVGGEFGRGDPIYCVAPDGHRVAKGMANYTAAQVRRIAGRHSSEFELVLGFLGDEEVIHRDNLVMLERVTAVNDGRAGGG